MPVTYQLFNANGESNLFSHNQPDGGQTLTLEIVNAKSAVGGHITLEEPVGDLAAGGYHFAICFQTGLLNNPEKVAVVAAERGWEISKRIVDPADASDCFYIRRTKSADMSFSMGKTLRFTISGIRVKSGETKNYATKLNHRFMHEGPAGDKRPVEGFMERLLTVLNSFSVDLTDFGGLTQIGDRIGKLEDDFNGLPDKKKIDNLDERDKLLTKGLDLTDELLELIAETAVLPLRAQIVGGWNFLRPNEPTELKVEITPNPHFFTAHETSKSLTATKDKSVITIEDGNGTFEAVSHSNSDWNSEANAEKTLITVKPTKNTVIADGNRYTVSLTYKSGVKDKKFDFGITFLKLNFKGFAVETKTKNKTNDSVERGIKTSQLVDFDLHVPLYVGPLQFADGKVGIGKKPDAALDVNGSINSDTLLVVKKVNVGSKFGKNPDAALDVTGSIGSDTLVVAEKVNIGSKDLLSDYSCRIEHLNGSSLALSRPVNNTIFGVSTDFLLQNSLNAYVPYARITGSIADNASGKEVGFLSFQVRTKGVLNNGYGQEKMRITADGKVGIGKEPESELDVKGTIKALKIALGTIADLEAKIKQLDDKIIELNRRPIKELAIGDYFEGGIIIFFEESNERLIVIIAAQQVLTNRKPDDAVSNLEIVKFGRTYDDWKIPNEIHMKNLLEWIHNKDLFDFNTRSKTFFCKTSNTDRPNDTFDVSWSEGKVNITKHEGPQDNSLNVWPVRKVTLSGTKGTRDFN